MDACCMSAVLPKARAVFMGYSADKRKRRNQHRENARVLMKYSGTPHAVGRWHLAQARWL